MTFLSYYHFNIIISRSCECTSSYTESWCPYFHRLQENYFIVVVYIRVNEQAMKTKEKRVISDCFNTEALD